MKQSTSSTNFGGIPLDTNTLAGQWMTFNHMANHYRKLLNVKPRVDTGLVGSGAINNGNLRGSYHNLSSNSKMLQSSKSGKKKKNNNHSTNSNHANNSSSYNHEHHHHDPSRHQRDSLMYSSHPDHLNATSSSRKTKPKAHDTVELTIKSPLKNGRSKKKALTSHYPEYQVVFGPSSIRSSSDAFMSDDTASTVSNDNNTPPPDVQAPIGVTEKIRRFLNHIHHLELTTTAAAKTSSISKKSKRVSTAPLTPTSSSVVTTDRPVTVSSAIVASHSERHQARHSKCFLPWEPPSPQSPRKCASSSVPSTTGGKALRAQSSSNKQSVKLFGSSTPKIIVNEDHHHQFSKSAHHIQHHHQSPRMSRNKFTGSGGDIHVMVPEKEFTSGKRPKTRKRAESIASIGTICGSEELTAEDDILTMKDIYSNLESSLGDDDILLQRIMEHNLHSIKQRKNSSRKVLHEQDRNRRHQEVRICSGESNLVKSSSVASLIPSSSNDGGGSCGNAFTKPISNSHRHRHHDKSYEGAAIIPHANNKDSSRDSAYGFSSGESRITTRESTPEKKRLSEELLHMRGRHKAHVEFEKPCKDVQTSSTSIDKRYSKSSKDRQREGLSNKKGKSTSTSTNDLRRRDSNERYIVFLTDLTQDIVRKGIYTNKGLKTLFKSHLEQNKELNPDKLGEMVERLRMDLGIPKDDSLDKIEFGYGSVSDVSTTSFFYTPSVPSRDKLSTESVILSAKTAASNSATNAAELQPEDLPSNPSSHPSSPSPTTIIPTAVIPEVVDAATAITSTTTGFSSSGGPNSSNPSSTTGTNEDGSGAGDFISVPDDSEDNFIVAKGEDEEEDEGNVHNDDELSLSETEVSQYLKVAGLDDGTMQSVMGILKS